jgi:hypothetical protein
MNSLKREVFKAVPSGGWNAEEFEKRGTWLVQEFVRVHRGVVKKHSARMSRFWGAMFKKQVEQIVQFAKKRMPSKALGFYGTDEEVWEAALIEVFNDKNQTAETYMNSKEILGDTATESYLLAAALLANIKPTQERLMNLRKRIGDISAETTRINKTTEKIIRRELLASKDAGNSITETVRKLENKVSSLNRRIPTIVRTEMGRASDEGVKASMKHNGTVTHCSVIGCASSSDHPTLGVNCNIENVAIEEIDKVTFHINHTGAWIPSKFMTTDEILKNRVNQTTDVLRDPASFPSKPIRQSTSSRDQHSRKGIFNNKRAKLHTSIKRRVFAPFMSIEGRSVKASDDVFVIAGGSYAAKNAGYISILPQGERLNVDCGTLQEFFPEYGNMYDVSRQNNASAYVSEECRYLANEIAYEAIDRGISIQLNVMGAGLPKSANDKTSTYRRKGHSVKAYYAVARPEYLAQQAAMIAEKTGKAVPEYARLTSIQSLSDNLMRIVESGMFDTFVLYDSEESKVIFEYMNQIASVRDIHLYKRFLLHSDRNMEIDRNNGALPYLGGSRAAARIDAVERLEPSEIQTIATEIVNGIDAGDSLLPTSEKYMRARKIIELDIADNEARGYSLDFQMYNEI